MPPQKKRKMWLLMKDHVTSMPLKYLSSFYWSLFSASWYSRAWTRKGFCGDHCEIRVSIWAQHGITQHRINQAPAQLDAKPHLSAAYTAGFRKLLPVSWRDKLLSERQRCSETMRLWSSFSFSDSGFPSHLRKRDSLCAAPLTHWSRWAGGFASRGSTILLPSLCPSGLCSAGDCVRLLWPLGTLQERSQTPSEVAEIKDMKCEVLSQWGSQQVTRYSLPPMQALHAMFSDSSSD